MYMPATLETGADLVLEADPHASACADFKWRLRPPETPPQRQEKRLAMTETRAPAPEFTPEAVRSVLTAAAIAERQPRHNITGCRVADARERLGEILVEASIMLAEPPFMNGRESKARPEFTAKCQTILAAAGYRARIESPTLIVITETTPAAITGNDSTAAGKD